MKHVKEELTDELKEDSKMGVAATPQTKRRKPLDVGYVEKLLDVRLARMEAADEQIRTLELEKKVLNEEVSGLC
jgi:hypothetical protein